MHRIKKNGFTLVELLAVIVVIAIILLMIRPKITGVIDDSRIKTFETSAKNMVKTAYTNVINKGTVISNNTVFNCKDIIKLNNEDYDLNNCTITINDNDARIYVLGKGSYEGYSCSGTLNNMYCDKEEITIERQAFQISNEELISKVRELQNSGLASNSYTITNSVISPSLDIESELPITGEIYVYDNDIALLTYSDKWCAVKNFDDYAFNIYDKDSERCSDGVFGITYIPVKYLESSGTQYIDTEVYLSFPTDFELEIMTTGYKSWQRIWGLSQSAGNTKYQAEASSSTVYSIGNNGTSSISLTIPLNEKVIVTKQGLTYTSMQNREVISSVSATNGEYINSDYSVYLWAGYDKISTTALLKIYGAKFYQNSVIVRNLIPCYRKSDNKPGLYDKVNNKFYTNNGTREFGYETLDGTYVAPQ